MGCISSKPLTDNRLNTGGVDASHLGADVGRARGRRRSYGGNIGSDSRRSEEVSAPAPRPVLNLHLNKMFPGRQFVRSPLSQYEQASVGVARWPILQYRKRQDMYGRRFYAAAQCISDEIVSGNFKTFESIWNRAAEERQSWLPIEQRSNFAGGYVRDDERRTPLEEQYAFLVNVAHQNLNMTKEKSSIPEGYDSDDEDRPDADFMAHWVFQHVLEIEGEKIPLTKVFTPVNDTDFESGIARRVNSYNDLEGYAAVLDHTHPENIKPATDYAEALFNRIAEASEQKEIIRLLGSLHWVMCHAMPDKRGSAAKAELSVRAVAMAKGIELPAFQEGVVPDMQAFGMGHNEFSKQYSEMFEKHIV